MGFVEAQVQKERREVVQACEEGENSREREEFKREAGLQYPALS